jgi:RecB family endonuclease NucS
LSQVDVRKLIDESFNCAYFTLNLNVFESSSEKHGELVEFIKRWFEGLEKGVKYITEYPLSLGVAKSKADIVCIDSRGVVHIVEAKSA